MTNDQGLMTTREETLVLEPGLAELGPGLERRFRGNLELGDAVTQAQAVGSALEEVQLDRHARLAQGQREQEAVLGRDGLVGVGVDQERRGRVLGDLPFVREALDQWPRRVVTQ